MPERIVEPNQLYEEGWTLLEEEQFDQALEIGRRLERMRWTGSFELQAAVYEAQNNLEAAVEVLKRGIDEAGGPYLLFSRLGNTLSDLERYQEALSAYEKGLALAETDECLFRMNRGLVFSRMDDHESALQELLTIVDEVEERGTDDGMYWHFKSYHAGALSELGLGGDLANLVEPLSKLIFDRDDYSEMKSNIAATYAISLWKQKEIAASDRWLDRAIYLDRDCWNAKWLVREAELERTEPGGKFYYLTTDGIWPKEISGELKDLGALACFEVVAEDPDSALNYALKFTEPLLAPTLRVDEFKILDENSPEPKGVYEVHPYLLYDPDGDDDAE